MKITETRIKIADIVEDYENNNELGVFGWGGKLNIRPPYQREFVYDPEQQEAVIDTVMKGFPLNTMYFAVNTDGTYEVIDGQHRIVSICEFYEGSYSFKWEGNRMKIENFMRSRKELYKAFLDYELTVYLCEGNDSERLDWFRTINTYGTKVNEQEMLNANYAGSWTIDARKYFSKSRCPALQIGADKFISGKWIYQDYLATVLHWITNSKAKCDSDCQEYMAQHQNDENAIELWEYFESVIDWIKKTFTVYRKEMKGIDWGILYNKYGKNYYDPEEIEAQVNELYEDEEVTNKKGIYKYIFDNDIRNLHLRKFSDVLKHKKYAEQNGICPHCGKHFALNEMEGDHIIPWSKGGKTGYDNLQMLCRKCNGEKSNY